MIREKRAHKKHDSNWNSWKVAWKKYWRLSCKVADLTRLWRLNTVLNAKKWKFATWKLLIFGCNNLHMRISSGQQAMIIKQLHVYKVHSWHSIRPSRKCSAAHWKVKFDCSSSLRKHIYKTLRKMWNSQAPQSLSLQQLKLPNGYTKKTQSRRKKATLFIAQ